MTVAMVAFWALVVFAVLALFRTERPGESTPDRRDPMQILDELEQHLRGRYAKTISL